MAKVLRRQKHDLAFDEIFCKAYRPAIFVCMQHSVSATTPPL